VQQEPRFAATHKTLRRLPVLASLQSGCLSSRPAPRTCTHCPVAGPAWNKPFRKVRTRQLRASQHLPGPLLCAPVGSTSPTPDPPQGHGSTHQFPHNHLTPHTRLEREKSTPYTVGAAQKDTAREIAAKLASFARSLARNHLLLIGWLRLCPLRALVGSLTPAPPVRRRSRLMILPPSSSATNSHHHAVTSHYACSLPPHATPATSKHKTNPLTAETMDAPLQLPRHRHRRHRASVAIAKNPPSSSRQTRSPTARSSRAMDAQRDRTEATRPDLNHRARFSPPRRQIADRQLESPSRASTNAPPPFPLIATKLTPNTMNAPEPTSSTNRDLDPNPNSRPHSQRKVARLPRSPATNLPNASGRSSYLNSLNLAKSTGLIE